MPYDGASQLTLTLNGVEQPQTTAGFTTAGQIVGFANLRTTTKNSVLTVRNPALSTVPIGIGTAIVSVTGQLNIDLIEY
jgi:hypothetical protein